MCSLSKICCSSFIPPSAINIMQYRFAARYKKISNFPREFSCYTYGCVYKHGELPKLPIIVLDSPLGSLEVERMGKNFYMRPFHPLVYPILKLRYPGNKKKVIYIFSCASVNNFTYSIIFKNNNWLVQKNTDFFGFVYSVQGR